MDSGFSCSSPIGQRFSMLSSLIGQRFPCSSTEWLDSVLPCSSIIDQRFLHALVYDWTAFLHALVYDWTAILHALVYDWTAILHALVYDLTTIFHALVYDLPASVPVSGRGGRRRDGWAPAWWCRPQTPGPTARQPAWPAPGSSASAPGQHEQSFNQQPVFWSRSILDRLRLQLVKMAAPAPAPSYSPIVHIFAEKRCFFVLESWSRCRLFFHDSGQKGRLQLNTTANSGMPGCRRRRVVFILLTQTSASGECIFFNLNQLARFSLQDNWDIL